MTHREKSGSGRLQRATALAAALALTPLPLAAAGADAGPRPGAIRASVAKISAKDTKTLSRSGRSEARTARQDTPGQDRSFFKTGPGILALAVMIAGTGYAIYSTQNDRIKSPGKE